MQLTSKRSYATAVTTSTTVPLPAAAVSTPTAPGQTGPEKSPIARNIASGESNKSRVKVNGARKIWGTVPTCSAGAIAATISKLVPTKLQLRIRRKTKMLRGLVQSPCGKINVIMTLTFYPPPPPPPPLNVTAF